MPETVIRITPLPAGSGTFAAIWVSDQLVTGALYPESVIVLLPCVDRKPVPVINICEPSAPLLGVTEVMIGLGTVKRMSGLLEMPFTVTLTAPVVGLEGTVAMICVSLQLVVVA